MLACILIFTACISWKDGSHVRCRWHDECDLLPKSRICQQNYFLKGLDGSDGYQFMCPCREYREQEHPCALSLTFNTRRRFSLVFDQVPRDGVGSFGSDRFAHRLLSCLPTFSVPLHTVCDLQTNTVVRLPPTTLWRYMSPTALSFCRLSKLRL